MGPGLSYNWDIRPELRPTIRPTNYDIAWAAGIYEGEGSLQCHGPNGIQVRVGQKEFWLPERLRDLFGGSTLERQMNDQPFSEWHISGARARGFLLTVYGFLSPRRQGQIRGAM